MSVTNTANVNKLIFKYHILSSKATKTVRNYKLTYMVICVLLIYRYNSHFFQKETTIFFNKEGYSVLIVKIQISCFDS